MGQVSSQNRQVLLTTKVQVFLKYPVYVPCFAHTTAELHRTATCSSAIIRPPWISSQQHTSTLNSLWPHHPMPGESGLYCLYVYTHWTCPTYPLLGQLKELKKNQKTAPTSSQKIPKSSCVWILHRWPFESAKTGSQGPRHLFRRLFRLKAAGVAFDTLGYASEGFWQSADFSICFQSVNTGSGLFYPSIGANRAMIGYAACMQLSSPEVSHWSTFCVFTKPRWSFQPLDGKKTGSTEGTLGPKCAV